MSFVPVKAYLCAFRSNFIGRPGVMSVTHRHGTTTRFVPGNSVHIRMFGTVDSTTSDEVSKQQKLQDLINVYQMKGQVGPLDRSKLKSVLESLNGTQLSEPGSRKVFDDTMKFPTEFMIKVVGLNEPEFVTDMLGIVKKCLNTDHSQNFPFSTRETAGGKYVSLTVNPVFQTAEELYATYEAIGKDKRVKMTL